MMKKEELSVRENEVLKLLAEDCSNEIIGMRLCISSATAKFHVRNIIRKLGVNSRVGAAVHAVRAGLA